MQENKDDEIDRLIDWAENLDTDDEIESGKVGAIDFCTSDIADDRVGLPSGVIPDGEPAPLERRNINCGCAADEECEECATMKRGGYSGRRQASEGAP